jgi:hypothetical protein
VFVKLSDTNEKPPTPCGDGGFSRSLVMKMFINKKGIMSMESLPLDNKQYM